MALYRCYFLDRENRISEVETIEFDHDHEAIEEGSRLLRNEARFASFNGIEIWLGARRVHPAPGC